MFETHSYNSLRSGVRKQLLSQRIEIGVVTLTFTLIVITCILSILLLLHSNKVATKGYELRTLQTEVASLNLRHQKLEAIVAEKKSINTIASSNFIKETLYPINQLVIVQNDNKLAKK